MLYFKQMEFYNPNQFKICIEKIEKLKVDICSISKVDFYCQDARLVALDSLHVLFWSILFWLRSFDSLYKILPNDNKENRLLTEIGSKLSFDETASRMSKTLRLSLITLAHFKIDNLFSNILKDQTLPLENSFAYKISKILKLSSINDGVDQNILKAFTYIRNSLHNNGIHKNSNLSIKIGKLDYTFVEGERIECASWNHILNALNYVIDILDKVLLSENISKIQHVIPDDFASGR